MDVFGLDAKYVAQTYNRFRIVLARGKGALVWDNAGREYIDCVAGVAVSNVGHCHPKVVKAICEQARKLIATSNWFYNEEQPKLAEKIALITNKERTFFCNSGTEAVEAAIKLARKHTKKHGIIAMENAFHGRTIGSLSLTWNPKYKEQFAPLMEGAKHVKFNDAQALRDAIDEKIGAVIVEPIQGEGGIHVADAEYIKEVREICDEKSVLLIFDEVQTGFGRTGRMFAFQRFGVEPDILCMGKAIAGGMPMGAVAANDDIMSSFTLGDHGSTFGGNPLACAAANATIDVIVGEKLAEKAEKNGGYLLRSLMKVGLNARGLGLMVGVELAEPCRKYCEQLIEKGVLTTPTAVNVIRIVPPLVISRRQIKRVVDAFASVMPK